MDASAIALNQLRAYDPLTGGFLQPDEMDRLGRTDPEGYVAFRGNSLLYTDPTGAKSTIIANPDCTLEKEMDIINAANSAAMDIMKCHFGLCLVGDDYKRTLNYTLMTSTYGCPKPSNKKSAMDEYGADFWEIEKDGKTYSYLHDPMTGKIVKAFTATIAKFPIVLDKFAWSKKVSDKAAHRCLKQVLAHEASHKVLWREIPAWWSKFDLMKNEHELIIPTIDVCVTCD